jgi:integral membrane sensor domain MASE1
VRAAVGLCLFETVFYVAYQRGMSFTQSLGSPFWYPDTVLLCALLLTRQRHWGLLLLGTLPVRLLVAVPPGIPTWFLLASFANDSVKAIASAYLLRRLIPDLSRLGRPREFGLFVMVAVISVPALSALAGAASRRLLGYPFGPAWLQWFLGDALTNLVLTSAVLLWLPPYSERSGVRCPGASSKPRCSRWDWLRPRSSCSQVAPMPRERRLR